MPWLLDWCYISSLHSAVTSKKKGKSCPLFRSCLIGSSCHALVSKRFSRSISIAVSRLSLPFYYHFCTKNLEFNFCSIFLYYHTMNLRHNSVQVKGNLGQLSQQQATYLIYIYIFSTYLILTKPSLSGYVDVVTGPLSSFSLQCLLLGTQSNIRLSRDTNNNNKTSIWH